MPVFDTLCTLFQLENGCAGVFTMVLWSVSPKLIWRVDGTKGTLQIERNSDIGWHGFLVSFYRADGQCEKNFYPLCGIIEDLKAFIHDLTQATNKDVAGFVPLHCQKQFVSV